MVSVLNLIGYGPIESLKFFLSRFSQHYSITELDEELEKVWISHRKIKDLDKFTLSLSDNHFKIECKKIHSNPYKELDFLLQENAQKQFSSQRILNGILTKLHCCIAHYIITECLVLYNWGINSFELVFENEEFCIKLLKYQINCKRKRTIGNDEEDFRKWRMILTDQKKNMRLRCNSYDLFEEEERKILRCSKRGTRKPSSNCLQLERIYNYCDKPLLLSNKINVEIFNKDRILYDIKERQWPRKHSLSVSTPEELLEEIMKVEEKEKKNCGRALPHFIAGNLPILKRILGLILNNHKSIVKFDGYGRILKRHLKLTGFSRRNETNITLAPIPSNSISSYIAVILYKVVPLEFFGSNRVRKRFFREISRIVTAGKSENFNLRPLIEIISHNGSNLPWINEIREWEDPRRIISKIIKWLVINYVFLILKNHFYITDVGSSGYRLYYYRKGDVTGAITRWVRNQIRKENLQIVNGDLDHWRSVERNWLETGNIELDGNNREMKMDEETEHIFPVANVRFLPKTSENSELRIITNYRVKRTVLRSTDLEKRRLVKFFMDRHVKRQLMFRKLKLLLRFLTDQYGMGIKPLPNNPKLELAWMKALHLKETYGKLYYIKADVSDAFGSVVPSLLGAIIDEKLRVKSNQVVQLKKMRECRARNGGIECVIRKSFSDRPTENRLLVSRSIFVGSRRKLPSFNTSKLKRILDQVILHQYLRINGKHYRLTRGLTQGSAGSISPLLCEIYYSEMDRIHFHEFIASSECILLRAVDDYLLLTSNVEKARKFYEIVYNGIKDFNVTFNRRKLRSNVNDDASDCVNYLGLIFDVKNSTVRPDYGKYAEKGLLSTMRLSDPHGRMFSKRIPFICFRAMGIGSLKLLPVTLNGFYNSASVVREIVYAASVVQANRILSLTRHLVPGNEKNDLDVCVILSKALHRIASSVTRLNGSVTKWEIAWLFWSGAYFAFRKYSGAFPDALTVIRHRIEVLEAKCRNSERGRLLVLIKGEMSRGKGWKEMRESLKVITAMSKPSRRFL